jgi:predicted ABC-type sugar transport system permease subunit
MNAFPRSSIAGLGQKMGALALPLATLIAVIVFTLAEPEFLSSANLVGIVRQMVLIGIMATCATFNSGMIYSTCRFVQLRAKGAINTLALGLARVR